jgi:hypothetical protein
MKGSPRLPQSFENLVKRLYDASKFQEEWEGYCQRNMCGLVEKREREKLKEQTEV